MCNDSFLVGAVVFTLYILNFSLLLHPFQIIKRFGFSIYIVFIIYMHNVYLNA